MRARGAKGARVFAFPQVILILRSAVLIWFLISAL